MNTPTLRVLLVVSLPFTVLGVHTAWLSISGIRHPHPNWQFEQTVDWSETPDWDARGTPPLSIADAVAKASSKVGDYGSPESWVICAVSLQKNEFGKWVYELMFEDSTEEQSPLIVRVSLGGDVGVLNY